jgi:ATPase family associated with various cellular activities (AAA)
MRDVERRMKFKFNLFAKFAKKSKFSTIAGYDDLLEIVERAENAEESFNLGFQGPPASGKTLILDEIRNHYGDKCMYCDGSATTAPGLKDQLNDLWAEGLKIECIIIDEADKMSQKDQKGLLNLFEQGKMISQRVKKAYNFEIPKLKVYISLNDEEMLYPAFKSRFLMQYLPEYSYEQFLEVTAKMLVKLPGRLIEKLAYKVWFQMGMKDVRRVKQLGLLLDKRDSEEDIDRILDTTSKYSKKEPNGA